MPTALASVRPGRDPSAAPAGPAHPAQAAGSLAAPTPPFPANPTRAAGSAGRTALSTAFLVGLLAGPAAANAQQSESSRQQVALTIEDITAEANARSAAGVPAAEVEAWILRAMDQAGLSVREPPESWDVYGLARWNREAEARADAAPGPHDPPQRAAQPQRTPTDDYNVYRPSPPPAPRAPEPESGSRSAAATGIGKAPLQGPQTQD